MPDVVTSAPPRPRRREREHRWAVWRTHTIGVGSPLLERTRILQTPLFGVYLHRHHRPDRERHLHDHPWGFVSLILRGGYVEQWAPDADHAIAWARGSETHDRIRFWGRGSVHRIRRGEFHSIRNIDRSGTVSLLIVGRRRAGWGFATETGWVPHAEYAYTQIVAQAEILR